jgi:hypothetical protein
VSRLYFRVLESGDAWEVRAANADPGDLPAQFTTEAEAVAFAKHLATAVWRGTRTHTGVCVRGEHDDWREILRCGEDEADC